MKKIEHTKSWKKPTGVLKALNAFGKSDGNRNSNGKRHPTTAEKIKRNGAKFQALNVFNSGKKRASMSANASTRLRKTGTILKTVNALKSKENHTQPHNAHTLESNDKILASQPNLPSLGILKSPMEERKPSNTVKFSRKDDIRIIDPAAPNNLGERKRSANPRRKPSGNIRKQSRELLRRVNQEKESESEGYHSDCMSSNVLKKNSRHKSSLDRRQKYSSSKQRKDSRKKETSEQSSSASSSSSHDNYSLSKTKTSIESAGSNKSVVIRN